MEKVQFQITQMGLILRTILLHFGGPNEQFGIQKMSS